VSVFKPTIWLLCSLALAAVVGALYLKVVEKGIDASSNPKTTDASFGELVRVGDIDFTVLGVSRTSGGSGKNVLGQPATLSRPNFAIQIEATNSRGADGRTHDFSPLSMKVIDDSGVVHEAVACPQCPGQVGGALPTRITKGGTLEASYYFQLPSQALPAFVQYKPLFTQQQAKIDVRGAVR
jgi:hypothetical protein